MKLKEIVHVFMSEEITLAAITTVTVSSLGGQV